jgi:DNA integrity scanning protein DisA with diadenylate cyclase activity
MDGTWDAFSWMGTEVEDVLLFDPSPARFGAVRDAVEEAELTITVIAGDNAVGAERFVELPLHFDDTRQMIQFGIEGTLEQELIEIGDLVLCLTPMFDEEGDTLSRVRVTEGNRSGVYDLFVRSGSQPGVIRDVFEVAIELGKKGQKGSPVGALFVVGDSERVMGLSRALSYNPFERSQVYVGDQIVTVMLKEFSKLDGAYIIGDDGKIESAYRYLEASADGVEIPKGLGARHMSAAAITAETEATSIVLSESDGLVRAFKRGALIMEIDPDRY